eukprot:UN33023
MQLIYKKPGPIYDDIDVITEYTEFLEIFSTNKFISDCFLIIETYDENTEKLNSYVLYILDKIAFEIQKFPMFFSLRVFTLFERFHNNPMALKDKKYSSLKVFATKILREFFKRVENNPMLHCEVLFYKPPTVVAEILDPGCKRQMEEQKELMKKEKEEKRMARLAQEDDWKDQEEDGEVNFHKDPWTPEEDRELTEQFKQYENDTGCLDILKNILEMDCQASRSNREINNRLIHLGLKKAANR